MPAEDRVHLLDAKLELTRHLAPEERAELNAITLPAIDLPPGPIELDAVLRDHNAFAAAVVEGMVVQTLQIGEQSGVQLLGPGDLLIQPGAASPSWLEQVEFRLPGPARIAMLGDGFLGVARRAPRLISALYECVADQMQRVTGQLVICQLPRVDERVLAIMWLLAESWGQVTPGGVRLPLALTHETLGAMVGARRPTVTLALRKLTQEGSILHQDSGWLLLEPPPEAGRTPKVLGPELAGISVTRWAPPLEPPPDPSVFYADLKETVRLLREQHQQDRQETRDRLRRIRTTRVRTNATRQRITDDAVRKGHPPSS
jgi:CRP/FNR family transcriptional regulator, cyclic AMP receptor protein